MSDSNTKPGEREDEMSALALMARPLARVLAAELVQNSEFAELLCEVVSGQPERPALLNARALAQRLGVSGSTITALKREGLPHLIVGSEARFNEAECIAWLEARQARKAGAA